MTVLEVIQRSSEFLARKGVESARLQIELLLAHVLQMPRMKLYLNFDRPLTEPELERLRGLVKRRGDREPLQHIVGTTSFCGWEMAVDRRVLIPRPETELLLEQAVSLLNGESTNQSALDFGTGSGCLAIGLAKKCPELKVWAVDISLEAMEVARANAQRHGVESRIEWRTGDGFMALEAGEDFDLIVSNPPYIPTLEIEQLQPEVRDFDPRPALDGGPDGLLFYRRLATEAAGRLKPGGKLVVEFGDGQAEAISGLLAAKQWAVEKVVRDYSARERILIARPPD